MATKIKVRRDTSSNWSSSNPVLDEGEPGYDLTNKLMKIGDGTKNWNTLETVSKAGATTYDSSGTFTGNNTFSGTTTFDDSATFNQKASFNGTVRLSEVIENAVVTHTAYTTTANFDILSGGLYYNTDSADKNITANIRGDLNTTLNDILDSDESISISILFTVGDSAYNISNWQVDGSAVTPKWFDGLPPDSGTVNSINAYNMTIIKTDSAAFTILGGVGIYS